MPTEAGIQAAGTNPAIGHDADPTEDLTRLPKDTVFDLLKVERRREVLKYLHNVEDETTLSRIAEHIAAKENGIKRNQLSSKQRKRVYVGLYQCHLPKMDDVDVIDFDQARGHIGLRPEAEQLFPYLYLDPSNTGQRPSALRRALGTLGNLLTS